MLLVSTVNTNSGLAKAAGLSRQAGRRGAV